VGAKYQLISDGLQRAPAPIKAAAFLSENAGGLFQVGIAADEDKSREVAYNCALLDEMVTNGNLLLG
jgi:hypothetical protein